MSRVTVVEIDDDVALERANAMSPKTYSDGSTINFYDLLEQDSDVVREHAQQVKSAEVAERNAKKKRKFSGVGIFGSNRKRRQKENA
ncbi:hypothetical protein AB4254_09345 [Vibrio breoganii]